ncbi:MAG: FHA domain-containing protein [Deltaproteobacteria bacterium]|nr:FHA domain-containing protein [Deltaproteobacteria bacterium]
MKIVTVEIQKGEASLSRMVLTEGMALSIGTDASCNWRVGNRSAQRCRFEIEWSDSEAWIGRAEPSGSVSLSGRAVATRARLKHGDVIRFGDAELSVAVETALQPERRPRTRLLFGNSNERENQSHEHQGRELPAKANRALDGGGECAPSRIDAMATGLSALVSAKTRFADAGQGHGFALKSAVCGGQERSGESRTADSLPKTELIDPLQLLDEYTRYKNNLPTPAPVCKSQTPVPLRNKTFRRLYLAGMLLFLALLVLGIALFYFRTKKDDSLRAQESPPQADSPKAALIPINHSFQKAYLEPYAGHPAQAQSSKAIDPQPQPQHAAESNTEPHAARPATSELESSIIKLEREAIDFLIANDFRNALRVYENLAGASAQPIYSVMVRILKRRTQSLCSGDIECSSLSF